MTVVAGTPIGAIVADLEISRAWLVDPASGREGPGEIVVTDGVLEAVTWLDAACGHDRHLQADVNGAERVPESTDL